MNKMDYEPNDVDCDEDAKISGTIVDCDLTHDRLLALARKVVGTWDQETLETSANLETAKYTKYYTWDQETLVEYNVAALVEIYMYDYDRAVKDANDLGLTTDDLDGDKQHEI